LITFIRIYSFSLDSNCWWFSLYFVW